MGNQGFEGDERYESYNDKTGDINRIIHFKDYEYEQRRMLIAKMTPEEYRVYLQQTEIRPELEELKRLEYLNEVRLSVEPRISTRTVVFDPLMNDELNEGQLKYSENIIEVDKKISELVAGVDVKEIDADVKRRIEEAKHIDRLERLKKVNELGGGLENISRILTSKKVSELNLDNDNIKTIS